MDGWLAGCCSQAGERVAGLGWAFFLMQLLEVAALRQQLSLHSSGRGLTGFVVSGRVNPSSRLSAFVLCIPSATASAVIKLPKPAGPRCLSLICHDHLRLFFIFKFDFFFFFSKHFPHRRARDPSECGAQVAQRAHRSVGSVWVRVRAQGAPRLCLCTSVEES